MQTTKKGLHRAAIAAREPCGSPTEAVDGHQASINKI